MRILLVFFVGILLTSHDLKAQAPERPTSAEIHHQIQKLNFLGSALYVAAHPDDENTRLISYLSNNVKARTAYLSITRGDGGQNLIGPELRELLGVLRTQELLAARRIDGGQQFFTRANDFGYSKHPDETLKLWNKDEVLGDVVWTIRNFKPDVIINRFDHRSPGSTHGHHTSSAMLSVEAFDLVNDPEKYKEQLSLIEPWQPRRLFFNTSWWFYGSQEKFAEADKSKMLNMDVGVYYPMLGLSNNEIASIASSQHLCQGFGRITTRGSQPEYVEFLKGDMPEDKTNIFDGIDTSWSRIAGGKKVGELLYPIEENFDFKNPAKHIPQLIKAYQLLQETGDEHWKKIKLQELKDIILMVSGLYLEASSKNPIANPGGSSELTVELLNRSDAKVLLKSIGIPTLGLRQTKNIPLANNEKQNMELTIQIPKETAYTSPYWLNEKGTLGMYKVDDQELIGKPETPRAIEMEFVLDFDGSEITFSRPVIHRFSRPDKGEIYRPFEILPLATASINDKVIIFADGKPKNIPITVKAHADSLKGELELRSSGGWKVDQQMKPFEIAKKGDAQTLTFKLTPPDNEDESYISPIVHVNGQAIGKELVIIDYDHVPMQSILLPSEAKVVRLNIQKVGEHIGYIMGAGDEVPRSLEQIGYTVHTIDPSSIGDGSLKNYDAVVVGIRAYNVLPELKFKQKFLLDYVKEGGNLVLQYNTAGRWDRAYEGIAPYKLKLSRDRVTDESSEVDIIAKDHSLVNFPNLITKKDFEGWVQERGLYFPNEWSQEFTPILSMKDQGENAKMGSLVVAPYGEGHYIYTGLSFFRELPAGVSGAYKIFANMLSIGKDKVDTESDIKG